MLSILIKNAQFKGYVTISFRNIPLTVAIHHQQRMCYNHVTHTGDTSQYLNGGDEVSSGNP